MDPRAYTTGAPEPSFCQALCSGESANSLASRTLSSPSSSTIDIMQTASLVIVVPSTVEHVDVTCVVVKCHGLGQYSNTGTNVNDNLPRCFDNFVDIGLGVVGAISLRA